MEETGSCCVCNAPILRNLKVQLPDAQLRCCPTCGTWVYFPRKAQIEQNAVHDSPDYFEHPYFKLRRTLGSSQIARCKSIFSRLALVTSREALRGERVLDVGCDTGTFLTAAAQEFGVIPVGVDVNQKAVAAAAESGIEAYHATVERAPAHLRDFAAITAIDLIEHVSDPGALLAEIRARLRPGGLAYIETPNIRSAVYRIGRMLSVLGGGRPAGLYERLFPPQHIQYFTSESLSMLIRSSGLDLAKIGKRRLPSLHVAASLPIRAAMTGIQAIDGMIGEEILIWAVLRRPFA
jgi:2-polyprenyl-6-hydroxyphenyl methylase/3-demethylubiquinone-9 3-methyltransferase